jgi:hypothetical protein
MYDQSAPYVYFYSAKGKNLSGVTYTFSGCYSTYKLIHEDGGHQLFLDTVCKGRGIKPDDLWVTSLTPLKVPEKSQDLDGLEGDIAKGVLENCYGYGNVSQDMVDKTTKLIRKIIKLNS